MGTSCVELAGMNADVATSEVRCPRMDYAPHMRDLEAIDSELGLLLAIRKMTREAEGRTPNVARTDALLDERSGILVSSTTVGPL
jgi:hypothetical protein